MRLPIVLLVLPTFACQGILIGPRDSIDPIAETPDAEIVVSIDGGTIVPLPDAGLPLADAGPPLVRLAADLRVDRIDLFQTVRMPLVIDGGPADRDGLPVVAGRDALVRVHTEAIAGWTPRAITAVLEILEGDRVERFTDTRVPLLPADVADPESLFAIRVSAASIAPGARFRVWLEDPSGIEDAPQARYPSDESFADLEVEVVGGIALVLVPFSYDTDGSGRMPDVGDAQLARIRDELTARFPYSEIALRVHETVSWSRSTRYNGNVDWGAVNSTLIAMRDDENAPSREYWYGLVAPHTSRSSYCGSTYGSCVTGQAYVATLSGSRVGSGVGFGDVASVHTLAHEVGHMHGRSHAPCDTSGESGYPYYGGAIGVWGWDRRTGELYSPDATDIMGYCDDQWISDYTYRAIYERHLSLRAMAIETTARSAIARRFVFVDDGEVRWGDVHGLRTLPGDPIAGAWIDARGRAIATAEIGAIEVADDPERVFVIPASAPADAVAIVVDGIELALP